MPSALSWAITSLLLSAILGLASASLPLREHELLRYDVDLDAEPKLRYGKVLADFLQKRGPSAFAETYRGWQAWLQHAMPELFGSPALTQETQVTWLHALQAMHPATVAELQTLQAALAAASQNNGTEALDLPTLATVVSLYPLLNIAAKNTTDTKPSACTSTLVRKADGKVLHGRSLDYEPRDPMAETTVVLDFLRGGKRAYRCLHPLVYPSALQWFTCVRPGAFSLSVNARSQGIYTEHNASFRELIRRISVPGAYLLGELAEQAMQANTFDAALAVLVGKQDVSSNYFILAGAQGQGAVVTRFGNSSAADVWPLGEEGSDWSDGQPPWARVQTNVDHWVPLASGAYATHRRQHALDLLTKLGQSSLSKDSLLDVYLTTSARRGSQGRKTPEDTGVILRPSTIATLVMDPSMTQWSKPDADFWHVWAQTATIQPPSNSSMPSFVV
eukprot:TRINITY_DN92264_c0_g1_i1.p1 TRINITY_DN92264_c0_g1~~TRINITY_DN92264_c0_g1_i1.p1  ORF type:complete len:447 (+),score=81.58 TRINITY_DN92264_c0_g1_i1:51-1391(+)